MRTRLAAGIAATVASLLALPAAAHAVLPAPFVIAGGGSTPAADVGATEFVDAFSVFLSGINGLDAFPNGQVYATSSAGSYFQIREDDELRDDGNPPQIRKLRAKHGLADPGGVVGAPGSGLISLRSENKLVEFGPLPDFIENRVVGTGTAGHGDDTDSDPASSATFDAPGPLARLDFGPIVGGVLVGDNGTIRRVLFDDNGPHVQRIAGYVGPTPGSMGNGQDALAVGLGPVVDVSTAPGGTFYFVVADGLGANRVWFTDSAGKIWSMLYADAVQGLNDGFIYASGGYIKRARSSGGNVNGQPTTIAQPGGDITDVIVRDDGLYFSTGGTVQFIAATSIASGPADGEVVNSSTVAFTFGSWDDEATFACALEYNFASICADEYPNLTDGEHRFDVRATTNDNTLTDQVPWAARVFYVDTQVPTAPVAQTPGGGTTTTEFRPAFSWSPSSDPEKNGYASGVSNYEVFVDGQVAGTVAPSACSTVCSFVPESPLAAGSHTWRVRTLDKGGNAAESEERSLTVLGTPTAKLVVAPDRALTGRTVTFDASASETGGTPLTRFEWDLDGEPGYEVETGAAPTTTRSYATAQTLTVGVRVTNAGGLQSVALATVTVSSLASATKPVGISINDGAQFTNTPNVTLSASGPAFATTTLVSNDGGFGAAKSFPVAPSIQWRLDSSGPERLPKTVYVRYVGGIQTSETFTDDIILDEIAPKVAQATLNTGPTKSRASKVRTRRWRLALRATDSNSGVAKVQVTANKKKPGRLLAYKRKLTVRAASRPKYVRAQDRAGNFSSWKKIRTSR